MYENTWIINPYMMQVFEVYEAATIKSYTLLEVGWNVRIGREETLKNLEQMMTFRSDEALIVENLRP